MEIEYRGSSNQVEGIRRGVISFNLKVMAAICLSLGVCADSVWCICMVLYSGMESRGGSQLSCSITLLPYSLETRSVPRPGARLVAYKPQ